MHVPVLGYVPLVWVTEALDFLELGLQAAVSHPTLVQGTVLRPSGRILIIFNHGFISSPGRRICERFISHVLPFTEPSLSLLFALSWFSYFLFLLEYLLFLFRLFSSWEPFQMCVSLKKMVTTIERGIGIELNYQNILLMMEFST